MSVSPPPGDSLDANSRRHEHVEGPPKQTCDCGLSIRYLEAMASVAVEDISM